MIKYVAISFIAILLSACSSSSKKSESSQQKEDLNAKELLQGIWVDDESEEPLMYVKGDTIYYADAQKCSNYI